MNNPWQDLGDDFVLDMDKEYVRNYNKSTDNIQKKIQTHIPPTPFLGNPFTANVIILGKNPSYRSQEESDFTRREYRIENIKAATFASTYPWFYLDSRFSDTVGYDWWFKHLKTLLKETESRHGVSQEVALSRMAAIQWLGYHSTSFKRPKRLFPSQKYSFFLAKEALKRGACLIVLWGNGNDALWEEAVPGITKKRLGLNNKRTPTLTPGNLGRREFDMVVNLLGQ